MNAPISTETQCAASLHRIVQPHPLVTLYLGDCREVLKEIRGVHACVTDPPYGLRFMGKAWDYDVPEVEAWQLVREAMMPGSHLLAFFGTRTAHRGVTKIEDAGFEIRDQISWLYGSGFPKSHNLDGEWDGWGTALKPACEPICVARIPVCGTVAENVQAHGTGALNVNGCRVDTDARPLRVAENHGLDRNCYVGGAATQGGSKANGHTTQGRWPANVIHDGSDEVVANFPHSTSGAIDAVETGGGRIFKHAKAGFTTITRAASEGSAARFFYCAKASRAEREAGLENLEAAKAEGFGAKNGGYNEREWIDRKDGKGRVPVNAKRQPRRNTHPTVKPLALMEYLVKLVTREGQTVLDPYMGSGTTGIAALRLGRRFIGIERDEHSFEIALRRIERAAQERALL